MPYSPENPKYFKDEAGAEALNIKGDASRNEDAEKRGLSPKERETIRKRYESFRALGEIQLGGSGFRINVLGEGDPRLQSVKTLAFDHQRREVLVNPEFVAKRELSEPEQMYVFCHEISHFVQLVDDPDGYIGTFEKAKEEAGKYSEEQQRQIQEAWKTYFNIFMDIDDNARTEYALPTFRKSDSPDHPRKTLYRRLFEKTDYSQAPRHLQFLYASLRRAMLPDEEVIISDEVREKLLETEGKRFNYLGRTYDSFQDYVNKELGDPEANFTTFLYRLSRTAEPIFRELLAADAEEGNLGKPEGMPRFTEGEGDGGMLDEATARRITKEVKEAQKSPSERASNAAREEFRREMERAGFSEREMTRMEEIQKRANEVYWSLIDIWSIFLQTTYEPVWQMEEGFKSGKDLSIKRLVKDLPTLLSDPSNAKIFERRTLEKMNEGIEPRKINLHLILDLSGSMDREKREAAQESAYAVAKSLIQFRRNMIVKSGGPSPVDIHLRMTGFGGSTKELLELNEQERKARTLSDESPQELDRRLWKAIMGIARNDLGGTVDDKALKEADNWLSEEETAEALAANKEVAVVLEITDGETGTEKTSKQLVRKMNKMAGVYTRGIKIPGAIYADTPPARWGSEEGRGMLETLPASGTFERVWRENGQRLDDLNDLKKVMEKILYDALESQNKNR